MQSEKEKRNEIMEMIAHLCVGLSILFKGIDKLDHHGKELVGIFFILAGAAILTGSIFHKKYEQRWGSFKYFIFSTELFVMAILGYVQMKDGSHLLHYFSFGAAVLFIVPIVVLWRHNKKLQEQKLKVVATDGEGEDNSIA